ncbi:MAG: hypothetical protein ACTSX7_02995, partial [Alphaproteobacteria bacterium]
DLLHRITFEIVAEPSFTHNGLLASLLGKKVSTGLGAIHTLEIIGRAAWTLFRPKPSLHGHFPARFLPLFQASTQPLGHFDRRDSAVVKGRKGDIFRAEITEPEHAN